MKKYLIYKDGKSDKVWSIEVNGKSFTVTYGKAGTAGQTSTKEFDTEEKCMKEAEKLVSEKVKKGYGQSGTKSKSINGHPKSTGNDTGGSYGASSSLNKTPINRMLPRSDDAQHIR